MTRAYRNSSSFKVATLFLALLAISVIFLLLAFYFYAEDNQTAKLIIIFAALPLIVIAVSGYLISVFVVTRINRMAETANQIIRTGDLSKRLEIDSRWDDLSYLSKVLNDMLDKIQQLMMGVQHITDSVAHDLRTPLAKLRNNLEYVSSKNTSNEEIKPLIDEVDQVLKTFNSLLSLSSIESGRQSFQFKEFDLQQLIIDAVDFYAPLAHDKDIEINLETVDAIYVGDRDLFFQVIANLLDNAIKFTPAGGSIEIMMLKESYSTTISICDSGTGLTGDAFTKVFERFYRDPNHMTLPGSGLGLSLVQAVLNLHHAKIELTNATPGLKAKIVLTNHHD
ncbi:MAG: ATP-binding protein [Pseudomonadota bacterium]